MATIQTFEDVKAWQEAKLLTTEIYKHFKSSKDYSFRDQIQRASVSIMNNIAEGFERQTNKELKQFLYISKGSCGEVRSMVELAVELKYITPGDSKKFIEQTTTISKMLAGFIKTL